MGDDACAAAALPRDDRVEPLRTGVAADDVRRVADRSSGLVGAPRRQASDRLGGARQRVDLDDPVELLDAVTTAEKVDEAAERHCSRIVERHGQAPRMPLDAGPRHGDDVASRGVRSGETAEQRGTGAAGKPGRRRILDRRAERSGRGRHELPEEDALHGPRARIGRGRRRRRALARAGAAGREHEQDDPEHSAADHPGSIAIQRGIPSVR